MTLRFPLGHLGLAFALAGAMATPSFAQFVPDTFDGGGSGSTAESAVAAAIDDAVQTASGFGLFACEIVGEPAVFFSPNRLRPFSAQVTLICD
jgi:hypothetical protein